MGSSILLIPGLFLGLIAKIVEVLGIMTMEEFSAGFVSMFENLMNFLDANTGRIMEVLELFTPVRDFLWKLFA